MLAFTKYIIVSPISSVSYISKYLSTLALPLIQVRNSSPAISDKTRAFCPFPQLLACTFYQICMRDRRQMRERKKQFMETCQVYGTGVAVRIASRIRSKITVQWFSHKTTISRFTFFLNVLFFSPLTRIPFIASSSTSCIHHIKIKRPFSFRIHHSPTFRVTWSELSAKLPGRKFF